MENSPSQRLKNLRKSKGYRTAEEAAAAHGWNAHTYKAHEDGARGIKPPVAGEYAKAYGSSPEYILFGTPARGEIPPDGETDIQNPLRNQVVGFPVTNLLQSPSLSKRQVHVYGSLGAASNHAVYFTDDNIVDTIDEPVELAKVKDPIVMVIKGDSMEPRYYDGDYVSVNKWKRPKMGQDCVLVFEEDGRAIVKRYLGESASEFKLMQHNPAPGEKKEFTIKKNKIRDVYSIVGRPCP